MRANIGKEGWRGRSKTTPRNHLFHGFHLLLLQIDRFGPGVTRRLARPRSTFLSIILACSPSRWNAFGRMPTSIMIYRTFLVASALLEIFLSMSEVSFCCAVWADRPQKSRIWRYCRNESVGFKSIKNSAF